MSVTELPITVNDRPYTVKLDGRPGQPRYRILDQDGYGVQAVWGNPDAHLRSLRGRVEELEHTIERILAAEVAVELALRDT